MMEYMSYDYRLNAHKNKKSFQQFLIFVDILGRIKQWSGIVQNKLDVTKNEIDNLRKELLARACEMGIKMHEIEDLKAQITDYQNALLLDDKSLKNNPKTIKLERKEAPIRKKKDEFLQKNIGEDAKEINTTRTDQIKEEDNISKIDRVKNIKTAARADHIEEEEDVNKIDRVKNINTAARADQIEEEEDDEENAEDEENAKETRVIDESTDYQETTEDVKKIKRNKDTADQTEEIKRNVTEKRVQAFDKENKEESFQKRRDKENKENEVAYAPTTRPNKKTKRESELESEIIQLRKEYDRVIKERAEYENAIQRALLRGVSSLNVEALRVLRCPPIPCCTPCAPCPATAGIIPPEPVMCPAKNVKKYLRSAAANSAKIPRDRNGDQTDCITKRPCSNPCCIAGKSRKSADDSMVFLLRQGNEENLHDEDAIPVCGSTIVKKIELPPLRRFET
ncbi:uncharacterized protein [Anoplolepis gracilipes]|uniref:uncharacterized protein n=1 Tax=Anoplolepis gracilipes TaxID=354296 RepID=UPI003BA13F85